MVDPIYRNVNRLSFLSFKDGVTDTKNIMISITCQ